LVCPLTWNDWPESARKIFQLMRSPAGEELVLQKNVFVERILPASIMRKLSEDEMDVYRAPFREPGESRRPTLTWPREIPDDRERQRVMAGPELDAQAVHQRRARVDPGRRPARGLSRLAESARGHRAGPALRPGGLAGRHRPRRGCVRGEAIATLRVLRWSPGADERWQEYAVEAGADTTVLDALVEIQRGQDPGLAFRYACRVGMCGSCGVVVNGREREACGTPLSPLGPGRITVRPLYRFPVLRDLVVDMAPFTARMRAVGAAFTPGDGERRDARISGDSAERQEIDEAIECIGCGLCVSACTIVAHNARF